MLEDGKISNRQFIFLIVITITSTSIVLLPSLVYNEVKQDSWLTLFPLIGWGIISAYIIVSLGLMFKGKTIIEYSEIILGKGIGKIIGLIYCLFFIHINAAIIRDFSDLLVGAFFTETPNIFFVTGIVLASIYAVSSGLEVIGRVNEFIFPLFIIAIVGIVFLVFNDMDFKNLMPILAEGLTPIIRSTYYQAPFMNQMIVMSMLIPYLNIPQKARKSAFIAVVIIGSIQIFVLIGIIAVLGNATSQLSYPFLTLARYVNIGGIIERLEPITVFIWVAGVFVKIAVFHYCAVLSLAQLLELESYKTLVIPSGVILMILSIVLWDNIEQLIEETATVLPIPYLIIEIGIPAILLIIAKLRKRS